MSNEIGLKIGGWDDVWDLTLKQEGTWSDDKRDPGNWTGGKVGLGELKGTKYGISAAAFPQVNIEELTEDGAKALAMEYYWRRFSCQLFPPVIGFLIFDTGYNGGHPIQWVQRACGLTEDGISGKKTLEAVHSTSLGVICTRFLSYRLSYWTELITWETEGRGWANREAQLLLIISNNL